MKSLRYIFSMLVAFATLAAAAQASFQVIPPRNVVAGQKFQVTYRLTNGDGSSLQAPAVNGCSLLYGPSTSTSQSVQIINGQRSSSYTVDYSYIYRADKEGTYTIPAASIVADGKKLTTQATQFKILPPDSAPQRSNAGGYGGGYGSYDDDDYPSARTSTPDKAISKDDIFVRVILNKSHAYEGEAIECTLKLYTKFERINSFMVTTPPTFDGFLIEEINTQAQLNEMEHYKGQNYLTAVLKKCIIYPQKSGKLTISSGSYDLSVVQLERVSNGFFISARPIEKSMKLQPFSQTVEISPLPQPQPAAFTGAVGKFQFSSSLSSDAPRTGEAVSLKYVITGTGNIKYVKEPRPVIPSEFEQYTPRIDENTRVSGANMTGTVTVDYTLVPQSVGEFSIPAVEFVYFNPEQRQYVTLSSDSYKLKVAKGSGVTAGAVDQNAIQAKNTDILHIKLGNKNLQQTHTPMVYRAWYWSLFGVLAAMLIAWIWIARRQMKLDADVVGRRNSRANKVARRRLKAAAAFMKAHKSEQFYQELLQAMWGYLSDKLSIPASQLTRENITTTLAMRNVPEDLSNRVIRILDECEMARYTPDSSLDSSVETLYNEASDTINAMEKMKLGK